MINRLFAIGDIHGCFNSLKTLIEEKIQIKNSDKVILLGDYIDRGAHSKEVIDYIINLQDKGFDLITLSGNHEAMLLEAYSNEEYISGWIQNGGDETLKSFGIGSLEKLEFKYLNFFKNLKPFFEFEEYLFVHAGFNDEIENPFDDGYHMIWKCRDEYFNPLLSGRTIVHGHCAIPFSVCEERIKNNNRVIDLDTGCVYSNNIRYGRLTALELRTRRIHSV